MKNHPPVAGKACQVLHSKGRTEAKCFDGFT